MTDTCLHIKADGERCQSRNGLNLNGICPAHVDGAAERLKAAGVKGGEATVRAWQSPGLNPDELQPIVTIQDARKRIDTIGLALAQRRITEKECDSLTRNAETWIKAQSAINTQDLVNDLTRKLEEKEAELAELRRQMGGRAVRAVR